MESFKTNSLKIGLHNENEIPSCAAVHKTKDIVLFGNEAVNANENDYDLLIDWKVLVGKTQAEIAEKAAYDEALSRITAKYKDGIQTLLNQYIGYLADRINEHPFLEPPEIIIGIPLTSDYEKKQWRDRYKQHISKAFDVSKLPKPQFFPEPFAVFQHHWNKRTFSDTGEYQNILVIDVGGGTTNICLIQTTNHGILARGGGNKLPHGVKSIMTGGSTLDDLIYHRCSSSLRGHSFSYSLWSIRQAKEKIANKLKQVSDWSNDDYLSEIAEEVYLNGESPLSITALDIKITFCEKFWPVIKSTIDDSLDECFQKKLTKPVDKIDQVIFAGGTCQLPLFDLMFNQDFKSNDSRFSESIIIKETIFNNAVASGLAIEAFANSKNYKIKPTRVSSFLNEDLHLEVLHQLGSLESPIKLSCKTGGIEIDKQKGTLIRSPLNLSLFIDKKLSWSFKLKQKPTDFYYRFYKADVTTTTPQNDSLIKHIKVAKKNDRRNQKVYLESYIDEAGFLKSEIIFSNDDTHFKLEPYDLHDLSELEGSFFLGLDFGTNSTVCNYVNAKEALQKQILPEKYWVKEPVRERCFELEATVKNLLTAQDNEVQTLKDLNHDLLCDYVYHSNRIEGSLLARGQTKTLLEQYPQGLSNQAHKVKEKIESFSYIDDKTGEVKQAQRPVKDGLAAINLRDAFLFVEEMALSDDDRFTENELRQIHQLVMRGEESVKPGLYRNHNVDISDTSYVPPDWMDVQCLIKDMYSRFSSETFITQPAIIKAAEAHVWFVSIHPFSDGNGRVARLLANYFLWSGNQPPINLLSENRDRYYDSLDWCNTREVSKRGDMTDLASLFCDQFEDIVHELENRLQNDIATQAIPSTLTTEEIDPVIRSEGKSTVKFNNLLKKISDNKRHTYDARYNIWSNDFEALFSEVKKWTALLDDALAQKCKGGAKVINYPIIDKETFIAICNREKFSRSWFFKILFSTEVNKEEIVFYFGPPSLSVRKLSSKYETSCSLLVSRYDNKSARHVKLSNEHWGRITEICHDGNNFAVLESNKDIQPGKQTLKVISTEEWFTYMIEDVLTYKLGVPIND